VSPSTFFRYFPTKEDVVLQDDMDTRMLEALARQPSELSPIAAVRAAMRETWTSFTPSEWAQLKEGGRLSQEVPEIRARTMNEFARLINAFAEAIAGRIGRPPDDVRARVIAGAIIGVMMSIFLPEHLDPGEKLDLDRPPFGPESVGRVDEALALLEEGLPL
jgi:AcrR family transcriptional regulator